MRWAVLTEPEVPSATEAVPDDLRAFDPAALTIPDELGYLLDTWQPEDGRPEGFVVHLQDLHTQPEAQGHIAELIGRLHEHLGIRLVAVEGAEGLCDTELYASLPDPPSTARISTLFLHESLFTGSEHYAITHPGRVTLWGIEDATTYREQFQAYHEGQQHHHEIAATVSELLAPLHQRADALYPESLNALLAQRRAYERDEPESLQTYLTTLTALAAEAKHDLSHYPNLQALNGLEAARTALAMPSVSADMKELLAALSERLTVFERASLKRLAEEVNAKQTPFEAYAAHLSRLAESHGLSREAFPGFAGSLRYLERQRAIQWDAVVAEMEALHEAVEQSLLSTEEQKTVALLLRQLTLLQDLMTIRLSPRGWQVYQAQRSARIL